MRRRAGLLAGLMALALVAGACGSDDPNIEAGLGQGGGSEAQGSVSFAQPHDGDTVAPRFVVEMEATDFEIEPAGEVHEGAGHFHIMVDTDCVEPGEVIGKDDQHLHFGKGQTRAELFLEPGEHTLCLQAADGEHVALDLTDEITVTVDDSLAYVTLTVPEGETVASPVPLKMEAQNVDVLPAGQMVEGSGHFHVMIDTPCVATGEVIPKDDQHVHFGDGGTEKELELSPGEHTLCLQLADGAHVALPLTHTVTITVA